MELPLSATAHIDTINLHWFIHGRIKYFQILKSYI